MFIGLSKNLGAGFRIGVGTQIAKPKSARETAKELDSMFIQNCQRRMVSAVIACLHSRGICVSYREIEKHGNLPAVQEALAGIEPIAAAYSKRLKMYSDTGKINQQGKEQMLDSLYKAEDFLQSRRGNFDMKGCLSEWKKHQSAASKTRDVNIGTFSILLTAGFMIAGFSMWPAFIVAIVPAYFAFKKRKYMSDAGLQTKAEKEALLNAIPVRPSDPKLVLLELK